MNFVTSKEAYMTSSREDSVTQACMNQQDIISNKPTIYFCLRQEESKG